MHHIAKTCLKGEAHSEDVTGYLDWLPNDRKGPTPNAVIKRY